ncbi:MAG: phage holin family protein [Slackia sp.]|nr:phage holin family protein [Slackia sp.]
MKFILRILVTAIAVAAAVWLVPGIEVAATTETWVCVGVLALFLSLLDVSLKPVLQVLSLPVSVLTLGIFYLVVNTFVLYVASWMANGLFNVGFEIASFGSAFVASIVISIVSSIVGAITGAND